MLQASHIHTLDFHGCGSISSAAMWSLKTQMLQWSGIWLICWLPSLFKKFPYYPHNNEPKNRYIYICISSGLIWLRFSDLLNLFRHQSWTVFSFWHSLESCKTWMCLERSKIIFLVTESLLNLYLPLNKSLIKGKKYWPNEEQMFL